MSKPFFEVFPTLKVDEEIGRMFDEVEVSKVTTNSDRDFIKVHLLSRHLIPKRCVYEVERRLKEQLFGRSYIQIEVKEQYELSKQYTPENLMNEYFDSFLLELDQKSVVERSMLQNSKYEFREGNILCLTLKDSIVAQGKKESITAYLTDVFRHRFGRPIEIQVLYEKPKESKLKYNEARIRQEVDAILEQTAAVREESKLKKEQETVKEGGNNADAGNGRSAGRPKTLAQSEGASGGLKGQPKNASKEASYQKTGFGKGAKGSGPRGSFSYSRRSNDPNMIYGRDFEDRKSVV